MAINNILEIKEVSPRTITVYIAIAISIILTVYYLPNYFFLEKATADHTALLLNVFGVNVQSRSTNTAAFIDEIKIVKDCTGIQVFAVFLGLLLPLPKASVGRKAATLILLSLILYLANVFRIALEFWLVHFGFLPWSLAHYPLSLLIGIAGVLFLVLVTDQLLPEFGSFIVSITKMKAHK